MTETTQPNEQNDASTSVPELLTVREAAEKLRISKWKLYELIRSRKLDTIQIGRRRLVPAKAIEKLLDQLTRETNV
ncbi:helix-turn-helix domain-containing protein [Streptomyces sp. NPDC056835]|uniref:helix-turn-helix domain-containing protein n=1 Tax=Streptomyces sp. NPDC056835 TaxID=3345956 RepID=UPI0036767A0E